MAATFWHAWTGTTSAPPARACYDVINDHLEDPCPAEQVLLPRLRSEPVDDQRTVVLADGFSCRTQIHDLDSGGHEGVHLAEVLARPLHREPR